MRAAQGCHTVVHAAAWTGGPETPPDLAWRTNVDGTANVLAAAEAAGVTRFVYISSVAVYGVNKAPLIDETTATPRVGQAYPDSKITAEALVRGSGLPSVIIRPASTYGPRGDAWTLGPLRQIKAGRLVLLGRDTGLVTPGYIANVVDGLLLALVHPAATGETFNLCDERAVTYREFYLAYARMLGLDRLPAVPGWVAGLARLPAANWLRARMTRLSARGACTFAVIHRSSASPRPGASLGYTRPASTFATGMHLTEAWLRAEGHLD